MQTIKHQNRLPVYQRAQYLVSIKDSTRRGGWSPRPTWDRCAMETPVVVGYTVSGFDSRRSHHRRKPAMHNRAISPARAALPAGRPPRRSGAGISPAKASRRTIWQRSISNAPGDLKIQASLDFGVGHAGRSRCKSARCHQKNNRKGVTPNETQTDETFNGRKPKPTGLLHDLRQLQAPVFYSHRQAMRRLWRGASGQL